LAHRAAVSLYPANRPSGGGGGRRRPLGWRSAQITPSLWGWRPGESEGGRGREISGRDRERDFQWGVQPGERGREIPTRRWPGARREQLSQEEKGGERRDREQLCSVCTNLRRIPLPTTVHHAAMARPRGGEGRGGEMESRERTDGIGKGRSGRLEWRRWGGKIRIWKIFIEMENCYQASQNRVVPRAGTMSRSVSPSTIDLSCWAGPRHYQS
jgi:hypothetical protein